MLHQEFEHEIERIKERIQHENDIGHVYYQIVNLHEYGIRKNQEETIRENVDYMNKYKKSA